MELRKALIEQAPSLTLQRAAQSEIARLDDLVQRLGAEIAVSELDRRKLAAELEITRSAARSMGQTLNDAARVAGLQFGDCVSEKLVPAIVALKRGVSA